MALDGCAEDGHGNAENDDRGGGSEQNHFNLLNALSDLLMLPKDMLMDRTIRMEVNQTQYFLHICNTRH